MQTTKRLAAQFIGTLWLALGGGSAVLAGVSGAGYRVGGDEPAPIAVTGKT